MADLADRELDAAGITGPTLRTAYLRCRALHARYGRTYFLATRLLAPAQRPAVHAIGRSPSLTARPGGCGWGSICSCTRGTRFSSDASASVSKDVVTGS